MVALSPVSSVIDDPIYHKRHFFFRLDPQHRPSEKPIFNDQSPSPLDIRQNPTWHDCYLLAPLQQVAMHHPQHILDAINKCGTIVDMQYYPVHYHDGTAIPAGQALTLSMRTDILQCQSRHAYQWPALFEKAFAATQGRGSYNVLLHNDDPSIGLAWILGTSAYTISITRKNKEEKVQHLIELWKDKVCVIMLSKRHAYSVQDMTFENNRWHATLLSPTASSTSGKHHVLQVGTSDLARRIVAYTYAQIDNKP